MSDWWKMDCSGGPTQIAANFLMWVNTFLLLAGVFDTLLLWNITTGIPLIIIGVCGYCGAFVRDTTMLCVYMLCVTAVLTFQIVQTAIEWQSTVWSDNLYNKVFSVLCISVEGLCDIAAFIVWCRVRGVRKPTPRSDFEDDEEIRRPNKKEYEEV
eukprot:gnl/Spiro4/18087_TR9663_c0_g1_i1.p2 gnl/Spiro4/18087_TR9663_c0_g1~~gnl/Spiro4/18087_TR9663_c0_g1_i1.p2  ORF type:complete len:155 (-),score=47.36 gnl/Spiro4/18087_TR9663_c0_g1_i1:113-577(-)